MASSIQVFPLIGTATTINRTGHGPSAFGAEFAECSIIIEIMELFTNAFVFSESAWPNECHRSQRDERVHLIATLFVISVYYGKLLFWLQL